MARSVWNGGVNEWDERSSAVMGIPERSYCRIHSCENATAMCKLAMQANRQQLDHQAHHYRSSHDQGYLTLPRSADQSCYTCLSCHHIFNVTADHSVGPNTTIYYTLAQLLNFTKSYWIAWLQQESIIILWGTIRSMPIITPYFSAQVQYQKYEKAAKLYKKVYKSFYLLQGIQILLIKIYQYCNYSITQSICSWLIVSECCADL